ncbi:MAG: polysaccharide biosynthesis tyrosine autokinase [Deltaproteobacteria bacterium]|nr:polysaccharide biosynthesis tyrosine autokinase [Deltaproteobacteria bacterium]
MGTKKQQSVIPLISAVDPRSPFVEAYKGLRTNLHLSSLDKERRAILVTSSIRQEGKTTTACNLAFTMAQEGKKVLLLDADMRIPMIHRYFDLDKEQGLAAALLRSYEINLSQGSLDGDSPSDLLRIMAVQGKTGQLTVEMANEEIVLTLCDGKVIDVNHRGRNTEDRLGTLLIRSGKLTKDQALEALRIQQNSFQRLGQVLISSGFVRPEDLAAPLRVQIRETIHQLCALLGGKFTFREMPRAVVERDCPGFPEDIPLDYPAPRVEKRILENIQETSIPELHVMCTGPATPNPLELLASGRMRDLLGVLRSHYDRIVIDSPPLIPVADASLLASIADGVVLVIRAGRTSRDMVKRTKEQLEMTKTPILGVVLNDFDAEKSGYEYYKHYYYYKYE